MQSSGLVIHQVLGSCGFQWCSFNSCAFSKNSTNIQLMQFSLNEWRNSFTHVFLGSNHLTAADLVHAWAKDQVYLQQTKLLVLVQCAPVQSGILYISGLILKLLNQINIDFGKTYKRSFFYFILCFSLNAQPAIQILNRL